MGGHLRGRGLTPTNGPMHSVSPSSSGAMPSAHLAQDIPDRWFPGACLRSCPSWAHHTVLNPEAQAADTSSTQSPTSSSLTLQPWLWKPSASSLLIFSNSSEAGPQAQ